MRWSFTILCCGVLAVLSSGCGTKSDNPKKKALPTINRGVIAPEEIRRGDGTVQYVVRRLGMSSGGSSSVQLHEVSFYDTDGTTLLKTQNFFVGAMSGADVASVTYFHPNGKPKEKRNYDHKTGVLSNVTIHDVDGNEVETVQRNPEEVDLELLPYLQSPSRGTGKSQPTVAALAESSPADAYRELLAEIESRVTVSDKWKQTYKDLSPKDNQTAILFLREAVDDLNNPAVRMISKGAAAEHQAARWGAYSGVGLNTKLDSLIGGPLVIDEVLADTPAEQAGVKNGDKIIAIDGQAFEGWSVEAALSIIQGEPGTKVTLTIQRGEKTKDLVVARDLDRKIGVSVTYTEVGRARIITDVFEDSPASRAGLKVGDVLCTIDGRNDFEGSTSERPLSYNGSLGQPMSFGLRRGNTMVELELVREPIPHGLKQLLTQRRYSSNEGFVHLKITNLDWIGLPKAIDWDLKPATGTAILDLRGAGGNDGNIAAQVLARFLRHSVPLIGGQVCKPNSSYQEVYASTAVLHPYDGKLVVLVDSNTSGTAEALASALKESGRATIRGATTSGKSFSQVLVQKALPNGDRLSVLLPQLTFTDFEGKPIGEVVPEGKEVKDDAGNGSFNDSLAISATEGMNGGGGNVVLEILLILGALLAITKAVLILRKAPSVPSPTGLSLEKVDRAVSKRLSPEGIACALLALAAALCFAAVYLASSGVGAEKKSGPAVDGAIAVKVFVDDSPEGKMQAKIALELQKEYSGSIFFRIVQVEKNQEVFTDSGTSTAPSVEVIKVWLDSAGRKVGSSSNGYGVITKRKLVEQIEQALKPEDGKPTIKVERSK